MAEYENTNYVSYLIELAQSGRRNSFLDLCDINLRNIYSFIFRIVPDENTAKQISSEIFLSVWDNLRAINLEEPFFLWLKNRAVKFIIEYASKNPAIKTVKPNSTFFLDTNDKLDLLLLELPFEERLILILKDFEDYSYEEIAAFFASEELDYYTIKKIVHKCRETLMQGLES